MSIKEKRETSGPTGCEISETTKIFLARHGSTDWNLQGLAQGWTDIPLNDQGKREAAGLARRLAAGAWEIVVASDLLRARQTGEIIGEELGIPALLYPELRERKLGPLEGKTREEINQKYLPFWEDEATLPGLETRDQLWTRAERAINALAGIFSGRRVIVISHNGFVRAFYAACLGGKRERLGNAEGAPLVFENGVWREKKEKDGV